MNVCIVCQADGVLNALNHWYCVDHLEQGLADVKEFVDRVQEEMAKRFVGET